ncbi:MAG: type II toxin-antitoxin system VapC family toxin [Candidatus Aminicenantes bacterium]|jgi:predicted nucleic acid-binding protein
MTRYLLDTDIVSYLSDPNSPFHEPVFHKVRSLSDEDEIFISIITLYELEYGISCGSPDFVSMLSETEKNLLNRLPTIALSRTGAKIFGEIKYSYRKNVQENFKSKGELEKYLQKKNVDLIIASSAIETGSVLVSNDALFPRLKELRSDFMTENWAK